MGHFPRRTLGQISFRADMMESCKVNKVNPLTYMTYLLGNVRNRKITLLLPDEFDGSSVSQIG